MIEVLEYLMGARIIGILEAKKNHRKKEDKEPLIKEEGDNRE